MADWKDILSDKEEKLSDEQILRYLDGNISEEEKKELEKLAQKIQLEIKEEELTAYLEIFEHLEKIGKKFSDFSLKKDCQEIDFLTNFRRLKNDFVRLNKIEEINY